MNEGPTLSEVTEDLVRVLGNVVRLMDLRLPGELELQRRAEELERRVATLEEAARR